MPAADNAPTTVATHIEPTPTRRGYWIVNARGQVYALGDARWWGNATGLASTDRDTNREPQSLWA